MRIALVYPPFLNSITTTLPEFVNENEGFFQPLGILYIASYLKRTDDKTEILVVDAASERLDCRQVGARLADFSPDIVGISCWTFSLIDSLEVAREAKKRLPEALVCLGGPHATIFPEETTAFSEIDFVIAGDGERPFAELVKQLSGGKDLNAVPNLYYKRNGKVERSSLEYTEKQLDGLPFPDRTMLPLKNYYSLIDKGQLITTMVTSRGCPFQCKFCFQQNTGWRYRSIGNIMAEMEECVKLGVKNFFIFDETFTVNRQRVIGLCDEIKKRGLDINWSCRSRVDTIDEEMMDRLKEAGCTRISFGVESASPKVLERLNKQIDIARVEEVFRLAKKKRLVTLADFMIGCPDEDEEVTAATVDLALKLDPDYVQFSLFTLFPATELYAEALRDGVVKKDVWLDYARCPSRDFKPPIWDRYTEEKAAGLLVGAYNKFYLRPAYILKSLSRIRSLKEFGYYLKAGTGLMKAVFSGKV